MEDIVFDEEKIKLIKESINSFYNNKSIIHVNSNLKHKGVVNLECIIKEVYDNYFIVKFNNQFYKEMNITYIDLLIKNITIKELNF